MIQLSPGRTFIIVNMVRKRLLYRCPLLLMLVVLVEAFTGLSCSRSQRQSDILSDAERVVPTNPDDALSLINEIEPSDIKTDSLRALYYLVKTSAHRGNESSMASDSLIRFSFEYYKNRDRKRFAQSAALYALHRFWIGDAHGALGLLDSMASLKDIPDSLMVGLLQARIEVGGAGLDCEGNIANIRRLQELDKDSTHWLEYKYLVCENYQFAGCRGEALAVIEELIEYARANHLESALYEYEYEKIGILEEVGRYEESNMLVDYFLEHDPTPSSIPYLRFWKALNYFNMGDFPASARELSVADSCMKNIKDRDVDYYDSFAVPLHGFLEYRKYGVVRLVQLAKMNNIRKRQLARMESARQETEQNMLKQENLALSLKVQNERKTAIIIIVALAAIIIGLAAFWNIQKRKRKIIEAEERTETLQKMIDEMNTTTTVSKGNETLRRTMLQQLGIIKMVAETPTEQNREMLRKISSIDNDNNGSLVNWKNIYDIIDNLYSGFYSRLHERYGEILTDREEQIIVLMTAGFSTKEISVITGQTAATIYVRKTSIRKKLGVPEKEDIMVFLRQSGSI